MNFYEFQKNLNDVSPSMCLAKWTQVTIHLHNGTTHSCHHPRVHKIPLGEIKENPSALHNTSFKKERRKEMFKGIRPKECQYCWNIEDTGGTSDRAYKSYNSWSRDYFDKVVNSDWQDNYNPSYVEVSFSNACNLKCSYCSPIISSKWMEEIKQYGPYNTSKKQNNIEYYKEKDFLPIPERKHNPYVEAFWEWWPDLYKSLKVFRITGGEPLMVKDTFKILDYVIQNPNPDLQIAINTNLSIPDKLFNEFLNRAKKIIENKSLKKLKVYTSVEAWGEQAEYIRFGLNFDRLMNNVETLLEETPEIDIGIMAAYNALSIPSFDKLILKVKELRKKYKKKDELYLDVPYVREPEHQSILILPKSYAKYVKYHADLMKDFTKDEYDRMNRLYDLMISNKWDKNRLLTARQDFYTFFNEHDKRRNCSLEKTFPELADFYEFCGLLAEMK